MDATKLFRLVKFPLTMGHPASQVGINRAVGRSENPRGVANNFVGTTCPFPLGWNRVNLSEKIFPPFVSGSYGPECNTVRQQFSNRFGSLKPFRQRHCFDIQIRPLLFLPYNVANWIINFLKSCIILKINGLHYNLKQSNFRKKCISLWPSNQW